jgi:hypothetical protein
MRESIGKLSMFGNENVNPNRGKMEESKKMKKR